LDVQIENAYHKESEILTGGNVTTMFIYKVAANIIDKLNQQYAEEIEHQQHLIGKVVEPLFLVILGGLVGFILISMYTPLFKMSSGLEGM